MINYLRLNRRCALPIPLIGFQNVIFPVLVTVMQAAKTSAGTANQTNTPDPKLIPLLW